jgi:hypothetical protein
MIPLRIRDFYPSLGKMSRLLVQLVFGIRAALLRITDAFVPPGMLVLDGAFGMAKTRLLQVAIKLEIAQILEKEGSLGPTALATKVKADPDALYRALRALASYGIFRLRQDGRFANNRVSRALIPGRKGSVGSFVKYFSSESNSRAWENLGYSIATGKSAFDKTYGHDVWEHFAKNPEEGTDFGMAMRELTSLEAPLIARAFPFAAFESVCDVGGGSGTLLREILKAHPGIDAFFYDQAGPGETSVHDGVRRVAGSFFDTVPKGPDLYILKDVLHDWGDERALQILRNVRKAMSPGMTLLVIEMLVEPLSLELPGNLSDLHMMVACEGRQRSSLEIDKLLHQGGFRVERVIDLPSFHSIVEAKANT